MLIYTNNQGPPLWCKQLISYFESKLKFPLFDQIIRAFKINGEVIEICRTSHDKSFHDLIKCTRVPANSQICFLDDNYFPEMANENVFYINVKPYTHDLPISEMVKRFWNSKLREKLSLDPSKETRDQLEMKIEQLFYMYDYFVLPKTKEETNIDKIVSKKVLIHLQEFFDQTSNHSLTKSSSNSSMNSLTFTKSSKKGMSRKNKTRKNRS
jgi:hypothetical protein